MNHAVLIAIAAAGYLVSCANGANGAEPFASGSFREACSAAGKTKRIVLVDFYTTWCGPCKMLDQKTWKDAAVREWLTKTAVCRKIDAEKETALASRYKIRAYPTILLLKPDGTEIDRLVGYRDPKTFLVEARQALSGQDGVARAKAKLAEAGHDDPMERMKLARALQEKGRKAEALKEYLWCLDEGNKHGPGFYGVRLSFLLSDIKNLGAEYPPALEALKQRRDAARDALEKETADRNTVADFAAYNENLGEQDQTLTVYDALKARNATVSTALFDNVRELLLEKKRYADLMSGAGDLILRTSQELTQYKQSLPHLPADRDLREYMKQNVLEKCCGYYEALVGTDKVREAHAVRELILAFDSSAAAYTALVEHAERASRPEVVQKLVAQAKSALSAEDFNRVEQAAK